jgi:uncharacterized protein YraI
VEAAPPRPNGYPVTNVNLRAGPGTYYPVIVVVPTHAPISVLGCLGDYTWCDVFFQGSRGWMRSIYLKKWYSGYYYSLQDYAPRLGIRVVSFDINPYWDSNYRQRPFYRDKGRWGGSYGEGWTNRAVFYDRLEPYGDWIWLQGQYVWVPQKVGPYWRPYTVGRWVYTNRYGWMWSSREPFGWATYHYGRWGYSNRVGWFWVPGSRWAPAWVSWRKSKDYLAWAPLPPTPDEGLGLTVRVGAIPDYYWQVVPDRDFLDDDLPKRIVRDRNRDPILRQTQPLGNVTVVNNNVVVNNVVNVTYVEQKTEQKVVVHNVEKAKDEKQAGRVEGVAVEVFQPPADQTPSVVAPPAPKPIEEVAQESSTKQQNEGAPSTEELLVPAEIKALPELAGKAGEASPKEGAPPPPPVPPAEGTPPPAEEAAPPPPPPPAEAAQPSPPAEQAAPPPPPAPPAAEEAAPPPPAAEEAAPPPPQPAEEVPPPAPPAEEAAPPPPPPAEQAPPPSTEEAAPPPPAPDEEMAPKAKKGKRKKDQGDVPQPEAAPPAPQDLAPPPPPPAEDAAPLPPPAAEQAPAPPAPVEQAAPPPLPPAEQAAPPPPDEAPPPSAPPAEEAAPPSLPSEEQPKAKEEKPCPEGTAPADDGSCVPIQ